MEGNVGSNQRIKYAETQSLSVKYALTDTGLYGDIVRRFPAQPGQGVELLELLLPALAEGRHETLLFVPASDFYLFRDLQRLGLSFLGYLISSEESDDAISCALWCHESKWCRILEVNQLSDISEKLPHVLRIVLKYNGRIHHNPRESVSEYLTAARYKERFVLGVSRLEPLWEERTTDLPAAEDSRPAVTRDISEFQEICERRKSAKSFAKGESRISKTLLEAVLHDSFRRRPCGTRPFGTAGGIGRYDLYLVNRKIPDLEEGIWRIGWQDEQMQLVRKDAGAWEAMFAGALRQEHTREASCWLALVADSEEIAQRYGCPALRFMFLDAGGLLQQMHLSCTSLDIGFRALGGFDEKIWAAVLGLKETSHMILVGAVLGTEEVEAEK